MAVFEGVEIPDEYLEAISGRELTPEIRDAIIRFAESVKNELSLDLAIKWALRF